MGRGIMDASKSKVVSMSNHHPRSRVPPSFSCVGSLAVSIAALLLPSVAFAKQFSVSPMPASPYADTEVTTNIVFNGRRTDVKEVEIKFILECTSSNCIQVAFGTDEDGDGKLAFQETDALYGWRNGRYFVEDVRSGMRYEDPATSEDSDGIRTFAVNMRTARDYVPKTFSAQVDGADIFTNLAATVPAWLYRPKWNVMRITRRGPGASAEWFSCDIGYSFFVITVR